MTPTEKLADDLDPLCPPDGDWLLNRIHADIQNTRPDVPVEHRNVVLHAVANALRAIPVRALAQASEIKKAVAALLKEGKWPIFYTQDDRGLEEEEYAEFVGEVLARCHTDQPTLPMASEAMTRDALMVDPRLVDVVQAEAKRVSRALRLDTVDSKEVYRSMVAVCIEVAMTIAAPSQTSGEPCR